MSGDKPTPHPNYGPCDTLADGACAECAKGAPEAGVYAVGAHLWEKGGRRRARFHWTGDGWMDSICRAGDPVTFLSSTMKSYGWRYVGPLPQFKEAAPDPIETAIRLMAAEGLVEIKVTGRGLLWRTIPGWSEYPCR
jgi:hypothetical protein